jgi:hypothetical protein
MRDIVIKGIEQGMMQYTGDAGGLTVDTGDAGGLTVEPPCKPISLILMMKIPTLEL